MFWKARFEFQPDRISAKPLLFKIGLSVFSIFLFLRLPAIFLDPEWFFPRFLPLTLFLALAVYFQLKEFHLKNSIYIVLCSALFYIYVSLLPDIDASASAQMSTIHLLPIGFSLAAFSFLGQHIMSLKHRIRFIGMCGELFIISVLIGLGFIVFTLNYRLGSKEAPFPAPLLDVRRAIRWIKKAAPVYGGDANHFLAK